MAHKEMYVPSHQTRPPPPPPPQTHTTPNSLPTPTLPTAKGVWTFYGSATIHAPAKVVYSALRDFQSYPQWNKYTPTITTATKTNSVQVGDMITLAYRPEPTGDTMDVPCKIMTLNDAELSLCWRGCAMNIPTWIFLPEKVQKVTPIGEEECLYEIFETQAGPMAYVVKWSMGQKLSAMNQGIADGLKAYVEGK